MFINPSSLLKQPEMRPTYDQLLKHPWMVQDEGHDVDMAGWVERALEAKARRRRTGESASTSAPEMAVPISVSSDTSATNGA